MLLELIAFEENLRQGKEMEGSARMRMLIAMVMFWMVACSTSSGQAQAPFYLNPAISIDERVRDLLSRMTPEEKAGQWVHDAPAIDRLGVPAYSWWSEGLHGVARAGYATVFPQAIGLAATWDTPLLEAVGTAISDEARAKHHDFVRRGERGVYQGLSFWSPNINLFRDPRWGRGMETYGEDPYLTGKIGSAFIRGLQGKDPRYLKVIGTMKHFAVHSGPESERHAFDAVPSERDLRESYLPHFRTCVREADVQSVMCAYNRFDGVPCCGSDTLLTRILRKEWGFSGYVTSDCGAIGDIYNGHKVKRDAAEATGMSIRAGTDLNCSFGDSAPLEAIRRGLLTEAELDSAIGRLLRARFRLGMFDPPGLVPYSTLPMSVVGSDCHRALALEAARKSIVLLKNEANVLPLKSGLRNIAVIGPNANDVLSLLGNYYGTPEKPVLPLEGIRKRAGEMTEVSYSAGCAFADGVPLLEVVSGAFLHHPSTNSPAPGLRAECFRGRSADGVPVTTRIDAVLDMNWCAALPIDCGDSTHFTTTWTGLLTAPVTGQYQLGTFGFRRFHIVVDGTEIAGAEEASETPTYGPVSLRAGQSYRIRVEGTCRRSGSLAQLLWEIPRIDRETEAIALARNADVVIVALGLSPRLEGEQMDVAIAGFQGGDRTDLRLPESQRHLLHALIQVGKPLVLMLLNGSAVAAEDFGTIPAILECWYPGQAGGTAIAEVLFGDVNPSGRLPVTFYKSTADLPAFGNYSMIGRTYRFFTGEPLFAFGHGLSYTRFEYSGIRILNRTTEHAQNDSVECVVDIKNAGGRPGEEVVQFYVRPVDSRVPRPLRDLRGFSRVSLAPGESKPVSFLFTPSAVEFFESTTGQWRVEPGRYELLVGASSTDIRQTISIAVP